jgi:hypothetical protein
MTQPAAPAEGEAMFEVIKPVNYAQLADELKTALGNPDGFGCYLVGHRYDVPTSPTNPANLYVKPDSVDAEVVNMTIDAHQPQPDAEMPQPAAAPE